MSTQQPTLKDIESYKQEIEATIKRINSKSNKIRSFTLFYLRSLMRTKGFTDTEIAECLGSS